MYIAINLISCTISLNQWHMRLQNPLKSSEIHYSACQRVTLTVCFLDLRLARAISQLHFSWHFQEKPSRIKCTRGSKILYNPQNKSTTLNNCCSSHAEVSQIKCTWGYKILKIRKKQIHHSSVSRCSSYRLLPKPQNRENKSKWCNSQGLPSDPCALRQRSD